MSRASVERHLRVCDVGVEETARDTDRLVVLRSVGGFKK